MNKVYHLSTCSTCKRILSDLNLPKDTLFQDIKFEKIETTQLDEMKNLLGSYEGLFSRRALKYRSMGLDKKGLNENDYRDLILKEYTFLKRPVILLMGRIFVGSAKKTVEEIKSTLGN